MIEITAGHGEDVAAIMPVMGNAFHPGFGEAWTAAQCLSTLAMPGSHLWLARNGGDVAGFALSRGGGDQEELLLIGVAEHARRMGIGRKLIRALVEKACRDGRAAVFLEVREGNPAYDFYRDIGFRPLGRRPGYYKGNDGSRHDSITMSLHL
jgi:[ribosomal protein S18]-alanine N-acetyltransferase